MPSVRQATEKDVDTVVEMRVRFLCETTPAGEHHSETLAEQTRQYVLRKLPAGEFLVWFAEEDGQVVGTGGLFFFHHPPTPSSSSPLRAYLLNMYTVPEWRGRGVATLLLRHIIDYVRTTPAKRIYLHATEMGRPVYERLGFVATSSEMVLKL